MKKSNLFNGTRRFSLDLRLTFYEFLYSLLVNEKDGAINFVKDKKPIQNVADLIQKRIDGKSVTRLQWLSATSAVYTAAIVLDIVRFKSLLVETNAYEAAAGVAEAGYAISASQAELASLAIISAVNYSAENNKDKELRLYQLTKLIEH